MEEMKKKILIVITTSFVNYGGLTAVMMNYYRNIDKSKYIIDFASTNEISPKLLQEIEIFGSKYFNLGNRKKYLLKYLKKFYKCIKENKYDIVHVNGNSSTMFFELFSAKIGGIQKRISHGHTTRSNYPIIDTLLRPFFKYSYTDAIAVSDKAGKWLYGKNYTILNNAIDTKHYAFNSNVRDEVRKMLNVEDKFVVGNVGKLNIAKNQSFLLETFNKLLVEKPNAYLIIVGGGELECNLKLYAKTLGIQDRVLFYGMANDTSNLLQAMDVFVFPSVFEGFGMSLVEAQASGLPCIASANVPKETNLSEEVVYLSLDLDQKMWCEQIINVNLKDRETISKLNCSKILKSGYDIKKEAHELDSVYSK